LEDFIGSIRPQGIYLLISANRGDQAAILKRLERWR
jgi:hypothetical protein